MQALIVSTLVAAMSIHVAPAAAGPPRALDPHVRGTTPLARRLISAAPKQSPSLAQLFDELEPTDLIAYVSATMAPLPNRRPARLMFLTKAAGIRYVIIEISYGTTLPWDRAALLAHELRHAIEVAQAPEVCDQAGMEKLYRRIGWQSLAGSFETEAARVAGERVRWEVSHPGAQ